MRYDGDVDVHRGDFSFDAKRTHTSFLKFRKREDFTVTQGCLPARISNSFSFEAHFLWKSTISNLEQKQCWKSSSSCKLSLFFVDDANLHATRWIKGQSEGFSSQMLCSRSKLHRAFPTFIFAKESAFSPLLRLLLLHNFFERKLVTLEKLGAKKSRKN